MRTPLLDPELLQAFVAIAEHGSFTRAAVALNRTQSAVSMQIKRLEERMGTVLLRRQISGVVVSTAGEALLGYARRILALGEEAARHVQEQRLYGSVRLGIMEDYASVLLPPILSGFAAIHPHVGVEVEVGLTTLLKERIGEGFDIVIAMHPEGGGEGEFLRQEKPVWAAGPRTVLSPSGPLPVALYPSGCLFRKWGIEALQDAGQLWRLSFVSQNHAVVASFVADSAAVTIVKERTMPSNLRPLSEQDGLPKLPKADIRLHRAPLLSPAAGLLADHLATSLKSPAH